MPCYAQIDDDGMCVAEVEATMPLIDPRCIEIPAIGSGVLGKRWNGAAFQSVQADPVPQPLDEAALIDLCQSAGGMTDAQLVSAHGDPQLAAFWIKLRAASVVLPTDQRTQAGLAAVDALGYLPEGAQAVLDAWPTA